MSRPDQRVLRGLEYDVQEGDEFELAAEALAILAPFALSGMACEGYAALRVGACSFLALLYGQSSTTWIYARAFVPSWASS